MTARTTPPTLSGCAVLPPMEPAATPAPAPKAPKPKGKPARRKTADRFAVLNTFVDFTMRGLSRAEVLVWLVLYRDIRNGTARTSQCDIARRAGVNVRTVKRAIAGLHRRGLLAVVYRGSLRRGASSYRLNHLTPQQER